MSSSSNPSGTFNKPSSLPQTPHTPLPNTIHDRHIGMLGGTPATTNPTTTAAMTGSKTTMATTHTFNSSPPLIPRTSALQSSSSTTSPKMAQQFKTVSSCIRKNGTNPRPRTRNFRNPSQKFSLSSAPQVSSIIFGYCLST